jgi:predicted phage terminase large subunit-like protein
MNEGVLEWTRLKHLVVGDKLVSLKDALDPQGLKQNRGYVAPACQKSHTTEKTQMPPENLWGIMESGKVGYVSVGGQLAPKERVLHVIESNTPHQNVQQSSLGQAGLSIGMESPLNSIKKWWKSATTYVMSAGNPLQAATLAPIGMVNCVSTIAMTQEKLEDYSATIATLPLAMERHQAHLNELHRISDFTVDPIILITPDGEEEVFDVEIDKTENFIANGVVSHNTRWAKRDLTGKICQSVIDRDGELWDMISLPAILPTGKPLWPEFWSLDELSKLRDELPLPKWQAQYQQNPTSEEGAIVKRDWWKVWEGENPPPCEFVIQSWDTAFTKNERSDYSACTTWGVFHLNEDPENTNIILLDALKERLEFPDLKQRAMDMYTEWEPDACIVEAKASGAPLIFELRKMGIPVQEFTPTRGNDKITRVNSVSDLFASGKVWAPRKRWAEEVIEEMAAFPNSDHDDLVDSATQALIRFRKGGFLRLQSDEPDELKLFKSRRAVSYY